MQTIPYMFEINVLFFSCYLHCKNYTHVVMIHHFQASCSVAMDYYKSKCKWPDFQIYCIKCIQTLSPSYVPFYALLLHNFCGKDTQYAVVTVV